MATYIQGLTDYIPEIQPFKPDLNFYNKVLQTKQSQYDAALKSINNLYGSLLYGPLTAKDNIKKRDDYFKMIEQDIKKISAMDLSLPQNQAMAQNVFGAIMEDRDLMKDYAFTKNTLNEIDYAESFRRCKKPEDCPGGYWKQGVDYLYTKLDDFSKATPEQRMRMKNPSYVPFYNMPKEIEEWAKKNELVITAATNNGKYIIKYRNGKEIEPYLKETFMAVFGNDPRYQAMSHVNAVLMRKAHIANEASKFGGDEMKAEDDWFKQVMETTGQKILEIAKENEEILKRIKTKKGAIENMIETRGVPADNVTDDALSKEFQGIIAEEEIAESGNKYYDGLKDLFSKIGENPEDRELFRSRIDDITAAGLMEEQIGEITNNYATRNSSITDMSADPYYLESVQHSNKMAAIEAQHMSKMILLRAKQGGSKSGSYVNSYGTGNLDKPSFENGGPGQNTGEFGVEGSADLYAEAQQAMALGKRDMQTLPSQYLNVMLQYLDSQMKRSGPHADYAAQLKAEIFGSSYDPQTNNFVNGSAREASLFQMNFTPTQINDFYRKAQLAAKKSNVWLGSTYGELVGLEEEDENARAMYNSGWNALVNNSTVIREYGNNANTRPKEITDMNAWNNLFVDQGNKKYYIKDPNTYVLDAVQMMDPKVPLKERTQRALEDYYKNFNIYKKVFHGANQDMALMGKLTTTSGITVARWNADGGRSSKSVRFDWDYGAGPEARGNQSFYDLYQLMKSGAEVKVLSGEGSFSLTNEEFKERGDDLVARQALNVILSDMFVRTHGGTDGERSKYPRGSILRSQVAVNDYGKRSVTVYPDASYLKKAFATKVDKDHKVWGQSVDYWATNGITVVFNGKDDQGVTEKDFKMHPLSMVVNTGQPISITRPGTGGLTVQKVGNRVQLSGELYQTDQSGKILNTMRFDPNEYSYYVGDTGNPMMMNDFEPGMLLAGAKELMDQLYISNFYASQGLPVNQRIFDKNQIISLVQEKSFERGMGNLPYEVKKQRNEDAQMISDMQEYKRQLNLLRGVQ